MIRVIEELAELSLHAGPYALTIGNFDGVHLGHQQILKKLREIARQEGLSPAVLTFYNHPSEILQPNQQPALLSFPDERLQMLEKAGVEEVIALSFSPAIADLSARSFLELLQRYLPFKILILGHNAVLGKGREGGRSHIETLSESLKFHVHYLPLFEINGQPISSSLIRKAIQQGDLEAASRWLGRPYSLAGQRISGLGKGRVLGYPTLNLNVDKRCLPPFGVYAVEVLYKERLYPAIANLGLAPTVRSDTQPLLEVHLLEPVHIETSFLEVIFKAFIRSEQRFSSLEALQKQIAADIVVCHSFLC